MRSLIWRTLLVLAVAYTNAAGEPCSVGSPRTADEARGVLDDMESASCLGDSACARPLCRDVERWARSDSSRASLGEAVALLERIRAESERLDAALPGVVTLRRMLADWSDPDYLVRESSSIAVWSTAQLRLFPGTSQEVDWDAILGSVCERSPDSCTIVTRAAAEELLLAHLEWRVLERTVKPAREHTVALLARLDRRWMSYLAHGPAVYPWELCLVRRRLRPARAAETFPEPPDGQWLLLHPGTGYQYLHVRTAKLDEAVTVEALGFRRWSWRNDDLHLGFGASALLAWDGDLRGHTAVGVLVHTLPELSCGVAYRRVADRNARWPIYVSADLGRLITQRGELRKALEAGFRGTSTTKP